MPRKTTPKLSETLDDYLAIREINTAHNTFLNDRSLLRKFVREIGDRQTHQLDARTVERWFAEERKRQKASSYNKTLTRVRGFVSFLIRRGYLDADPTAELKPRPVVRTERRRLSSEQLWAMIEDNPNPRDRGMLALGANTGLRATDVAKLTVGDVDLDQGLLRVQIQKTNDLDWLPITAELDQELRLWLSWYAMRLAETGRQLQDGDYLFPCLGHAMQQQDGRVVELGAPIPDRKLTKPARVVHRALQRIGIQDTKGEGFHTLRRSVGRLVFELAAGEGHDAALRIAAAQLGHKSVTTTEIYLGLHADRVKRDQMLKGKGFLARPNGNVIPLHDAR